MEANAIRAVRMSVETGTDAAAGGMSWLWITLAIIAIIVVVVFLLRRRTTVPPPRPFAPQDQISSENAHAMLKLTHELAEAIRKARLDS